MKKKLCGIVAAVTCAAMFLSGCSLNKMTLDDMKEASLAKVDEIFDVKDIPTYNTADMSMSAEIPKETIDRVSKALGLEGSGYEELLSNLPKLVAEFNATVLQQDKNASGTMNFKVSGVSDATIAADFTILDDSLYLFIKDYAKTTALLKNMDKSVNGVTADMDKLNSVHQLTRDIVAACNDSMTDKNTTYVTKDVTMSVADNTVEASKFVTTLEHDELAALIEKCQVLADNNDVVKAYGENNEKFAEAFEKWRSIAKNLKENTSVSGTNTIYLIDDKIVGFELLLSNTSGNTALYAVKTCEKDGVYWYEVVCNVAAGEGDDEPCDVHLVIDAAPKSDKADNVHITYSYSGIVDGDGETLSGHGTFPLYNVDLEALSNNLIRGTIKLNNTTCGDTWSDAWSEFKEEYGIDVGVNLDIYMETTDDVKVTMTILDGETALGTVAFKCKMGVSDIAVTAPTENVEAYDTVDEYWATIDVESFAMDLLSALGLQDLMAGYDDSYDDSVAVGDNSSDDDWFAELYS